MPAGAKRRLSRRILISSFDKNPNPSKKKRDRMKLGLRRTISNIVEDKNEIIDEKDMNQYEEEKDTMNKQNSKNNRHKQETKKLLGT